ncbi:hypothetical protein BGZ89_003370, partial [Linnemannia elongata]
MPIAKKSLITYVIISRPRRRYRRIKKGQVVSHLTCNVRKCYETFPRNALCKPQISLDLMG